MSDHVATNADDGKQVPSDMTSSRPEVEKPIHFRELAPAMEFSCWVVVALAPFLRWVNGAAVTDDQFIIQASLVAMSLTGAIGLRLYNWRTDRRKNASLQVDQSHRE